MTDLSPKPEPGPKKPGTKKPGTKKPKILPVLSGPEVWPVYAPGIHDRFFFQWPELGYSDAVQKLVEKFGDAVTPRPPEIETRVMWIWGKDQRKYKMLARWSRRIDYEHRTEDVKAFLLELQQQIKVLPDDPLWSVKIRLDYYRPSTGFRSYAKAVHHRTYEWR